MKKEFTEIQKFNQSWLGILLAIIGLIPIYGIYKQIYLKEPFGNNPMSDNGLYLNLIFVLALIAFFIFIRLKTVIDNDKIQMNYFPFALKNVIWSDVKSVKIVDYGFVGGWGVRFSSKYGTIYNISGSKGLALELKNGKKFLIGTRKETELNIFLKEIISEVKNVEHL